MCPDNPELQYRAEFPVHFPLTVLTFSGQNNKEILPYIAFPGKFIFRGLMFLYTVATAMHIHMVVVCNNKTVQSRIEVFI